jgi:hypothetical protein
MNSCKLWKLVVSGCIVVLAISCSTTKKATPSAVAIENSKARQELITAIKDKNFDLMNSALENGATLDTGTEEGKELFILAVNSIKDLDLFKSLVDKTTDINIVVETEQKQKRINVLTT